jgi:hypothetical protein
LLILLQLLNIRLTERESILNELLAKKTRHLTMVKCLSVFIELRQYSTQLQVTLAHVAHLEKFAAYIKLFGIFNLEAHLLLF